MGDRTHRLDWTKRDDLWYVSIALNPDKLIKALTLEDLDRIAARVEELLVRELIEKGVLPNV